MDPLASTGGARSVCEERQSGFSAANFVANGPADNADIQQRFVRKLRILKHNDFWNVSKWLGGAYKSSTSHLDQQQTSVLIRDDKIKWLDFGTTPDPENLQPHHRFVWVKSGYSETIAWRKVQLTKQRNVDLTTYSLWAMPLNMGWVPVKVRRLQDWEKLKKYVPIHKKRMCAPMGSLPVWKGATMTTLRIQNNLWSLKHCPVLHIVHLATPFAQKCDHLKPPPPTHTFLKRPFLTDFK